MLGGYWEFLLPARFRVGHTKEIGARHAKAGQR